jgi:DNA-binding transcriptional LysR family regulator
MTEHPLDLDAVQAFVRIAELGSFTRAAEAMRTTQAAVSLKLKRLEERLGRRLVERTPRSLRHTIARSPYLPEPGSASPSASATMLRGRSSRH